MKMNKKAFAPILIFGIVILALVAIYFAAKGGLHMFAAPVIEKPGVLGGVPIIYTVPNLAGCSSTGGTDCSQTLWTYSNILKDNKLTFIFNYEYAGISDYGNFYDEWNKRNAKRTIAMVKLSDITDLTTNIKFYSRTQPDHSVGYFKANLVCGGSTTELFKLENNPGGADINSLDYTFNGNLNLKRNSGNLVITSTLPDGCSGTCAGSYGRFVSGIDSVNINSCGSESYIEFIAGMTTYVADKGCSLDGQLSFTQASISQPGDIVPTTFSSVFAKIKDWLLNLFDSVTFFSIAGSSQVAPGSVQTYALSLAAPQTNMMDSIWSDGTFSQHYCSVGLVDKTGAVLNEIPFEPCSDSWSKTYTVTVPQTLDKTALVAIMVETKQQYDLATNTWKVVGDTNNIVVKESMNLQGLVISGPGTISPPASIAAFLAKIWAWFTGLFA
ncbi:MAG: hypothetical protein EHM12_12910 [Dehalococcoidia bacterium]|nr:MAG: hypothetical protein EHM12_12910 [Dehalococcoidia bacterium]